MILNQDMILTAAQKASDDGLRSCLTCMNFQFRERGQQIVCTRRLAIVEETAKLTNGRLALANRRGRRCKLWVGDND